MTRLLGGRQFQGPLFGEGRFGLGMDHVDWVLSTVRLGPTGKCPEDHEKPGLTVFDADNSGSVACGGGADPVGNRFREIRLAVQTVDKRCKCGREMVAMLNFDSPNSADVPPTALHGGTTAIEPGLSFPTGAFGCSLLGPSLARAKAIADQYLDHQVAFVVLSDFQLFDSDVAGVLNEFANFPGQPHAVVLRARPPQILVDDPRVIVTEVGPSDPPGAVAKAVFGALTATRHLPAKRRAS